MVSPMAQRLFDLAAGHCTVNVLFHTPWLSREKRPDDSAPAIEDVTTFDGRTSLVVVGRTTAIWFDEDCSRGRVSASVEKDATDGEIVDE